MSKMPSNLLSVSFESIRVVSVYSYAQRRLWVVATFEMLLNRNPQSKYTGVPPGRRTKL